MDLRCSLPNYDLPFCLSFGGYAPSVCTFDIIDKCVGLAFMYGVEGLIRVVFP